MLPQLAAIALLTASGARKVRFLLRFNLISCSSTGWLSSQQAIPYSSYTPMKKTIIFAILFFNVFVMWAHTPQISSIALVQNKDNKWNLVISASLSAFQFEAMNSRPGQKIDSITADAFQTMIVRHLREQISIVANDQEAWLEKGKVILGHQTDINFDVAGMPDQLRSLQLQQLGFGSLRDHYCVLKVITKEQSSRNFILQKSTDFSTSLHLRDGQFIETSDRSKSPNWLLGGAIMAVLLVFSYFIYQKYRVLRLANLV
jgi:hypothetical protein